MPAKRAHGNLQVEKGKKLETVAEAAVTGMGVQPWRCTNQSGHDADMLDALPKL